MPNGSLHRDREAVTEKVFGSLIEDIPDFEVSAEEFVADRTHIAGQNDIRCS